MKTVIINCNLELSCTGEEYNSLLYDRGNELIWHGQEKSETIRFFSEKINSIKNTRVEVLGDIILV
jgi:hypothetical protein